MKISFLVTYYNQEKFVEQSIESILAIKKPCDWEIIVGDDGSTDGTISIVNDYIKRYPSNIKLYIMPRDPQKKYDSVKRASANRINILEKSTGDIYCTLDGDDYFCDTTFVSDAIEIFTKNKNISIVAFGFKYVMNGISGKEFVLPNSMKNSQLDKQTFLRNYYLHAGSFVHKKCFDCNRIEFIKKLGYFDDNNIVINSLNFGEIFAVNRVIYAYRQTGQSIYTSMNELEQAILNVQGMDVDLKLIDDFYGESIIQRYATAIILIFIWKKNIKEILGEEKFEKYEEGCLNLKPSYCYKLLRYDELSTTEMKNLKNNIKYIMKHNCKFTFKQFFKYFLWNMSK